MGLKNDLLRKLPHYVSDLSDFLNMKCFATALYLYLVSLCSLVAFGTLLSKYTGNEMVKHENYNQVIINSLNTLICDRELLNAFYLVQ